MSDIPHVGQLRRLTTNVNYAGAVGFDWYCRPTKTGGYGNRIRVGELGIGRDGDTFVIDEVLDNGHEVIVRWITKNMYSRIAWHRVQEVSKPL